jgi:hypothetical protein
MESLKRVSCVCGQEWRGTDAEIIAAVQQHGRDVHNMDATADEVLAMAVPDTAAGDDPTPR